MPDVAEKAPGTCKDVNAVVVVTKKARIPAPRHPSETALLYQWLMCANQAVYVQIVMGHALCGEAMLKLYSNLCPAQPSDPLNGLYRVIAHPLNERACCCLSVGGLGSHGL
jgi:hypothetical protein